MSSSRRHQGTAWGAWTLHPETRQYYRARLNRQGQYEYDFAQPPQATSGYSHYTTAQAAPRGDGVDDITSNFSGFQLQDPVYGVDTTDTQDASSDVSSAYTYGVPTDSVIHSSRSTGLEPSSASSYVESTHNYASSPPQDLSAFAPKGKAKAKKKSRNKGKSGPESHAEVQVEQGSVSDMQDPFYQKDESPNPDEIPDIQETAGPAYEGEEPVDEGPEVDASAAGYSTGQLEEASVVQDGGEAEYYSSGYQGHHDHEQPAAPEPNTEDHENDDAYSDDAYSAFDTTSTTQDLSVDDEEGHSMVGGSHDELLQGADPYGTGLAEDSSAMVSPYSQIPTYHVHDDPGQKTPRARSPLTGGMYNYPAYTNTINERLTEGQFRGGKVQEKDLWSRFSVAPSARFAPGQVFKIYWSEPRGDGHNNVTERSYLNHSGEKFYYSFRRFIVVANDEGHCLCVPILTYGRRACTKPGLKPQKHGIVYQSGSSPQKVAGEPELGFAPVRLEMYEGTEKLDYQSRVNYSKFQTIEHNYQVLFIGRIAPDDFRRVVTPAVDSCWKKKKRAH